MALNSTKDADYWRNRAKEARAVAVQMTDAHTKATMLAIAQDYESSLCGPSNVLRSRSSCLCCST